MLERRALLAMAAVLDIAMNARGQPVPAAVLASRHGLSPRVFETILRDLARSRIVKGTRGANGGYELARERRRISLGDIVRAVGGPPAGAWTEGLSVIGTAILPAVEPAWQAALRVLDEQTIDELVRRVSVDPTATRPDTGGFVI